MKPTLDRLDAAINSAELNAKPEVASALKMFRDDVTALVAERDELARKLAALTAEHSASIRNAP